MNDTVIASRTLMPISLRGVRVLHHREQGLAQAGAGEHHLQQDR